MVGTHPVVLVTSGRNLVHLSQFYTQSREKGTFPRQLDYNISFFLGGPWFDPTILTLLRFKNNGIRATVLRKHNNAVHTRRTCDEEKKTIWQSIGAHVPWLFWDDPSILAYCQYFFFPFFFGGGGGSKRGPFIFFFIQKFDTNETVSFQMDYIKH